jgi:hypothetical protein
MELILLGPGLGVLAITAGAFSLPTDRYTTYSTVVNKYHVS